MGRARETASPAATRRERQHVDAPSALLGGETSPRLDLVARARVAEFLCDALLVNQAGQRHRLRRPPPTARSTAMAFNPRLAPAYGTTRGFQSALAFMYH